MLLFIQFPQKDYDIDIQIKEVDSMIDKVDELMDMLNEFCTNVPETN
jgi:hypothetical protein